MEAAASNGLLKKDNAEFDFEQEEAVA